MRISSATAGRDLWQVVDRVSGLELGGAVNSARHRTMAESGGAILERLVAQHGGLDESRGVDDQLASAAQQWLAVTGTPDARGQAHSQPQAVDLSRIVSQYIGDTEKNLDAMFKDAERVGTTLLLDEADALLGKRPDVRDAHDRYAHLEVNDLPRRIEKVEADPIACCASRPCSD